MRARRRSAAASLLAIAAFLAAGCFYNPPGHLPSTVRILYSKATSDSLGAKTNVYFLVARSGNELRLTGEPGIDTQPTFAPRSLRVYFTRQTDGRSEIWSMEFDGSDERAVIADQGADVRDPAIAADESRIAYTRVTPSGSEVWTADPDGSDARVLLEGSGWSQPAWAADGRRLVVVGAADGVERLHVVAATGGTPRALAPAGPAPQTDPDWSPDGTRIVFRLGTGTSADIAVMQVDTGTISRLVENGIEEGQPSWSPTGERIVFVRRSEGKRNLWVMDADGGDVDDLTSSEEADAGDPEWL